MNENPRNYNLLEEQWIPVLWVDGEFSRVGISEALAQAGRIRQIAASNPMDRVAILRFLLAILYWCKGSTLTDADVTSPDSFPDEWLCRLEENEDYFNLLGNGRRF
jgi:CRISPR system Cascade subunit CasA